MKTKTKILLLMYSCLCMTTQLKADDISDIYGKTVKIAAGYDQLIKQSPSAVSVITSDDIEKIGAITIEEVLETVSGIHVSYANGFFPVYVIRGISSTVNTPVLIYLDGIPINNSVVSSSYFSLPHLTKNIDRIEIIKGPGSALHGADAFSGIINIITKKNLNTNAGSFTGSFDTFGGWANAGAEINDVKVNFSAQGISTKGSNGIVKRDRQSVIDDLLGSNASLAPSSVNRGREEIDIKLSAQYLDFANIYLRYVRNNSQNGIGNAKSLDNDGHLVSDAWITGIKFQFGEEDWQTKLNINYTGYVFDLKTNVFPKGAFGGSFNTPVFNNIGYTSHDFSTELSTVYKKIDNHTIHSGIGFEYDFSDNHKDKRNFIAAPFNNLIPIGSVVSSNDIGVQAFADERTRYNAHGFLQDEWTFFNDFTLTTGVRLDYFSDFGLSVNPRSSLIWNMSPSLTTKILYGQAFRTPSFFEMYSNNNVLITGNRDLNSETIQTVEWSIYKKWANKLITHLSIFWYETDDLIIDTPSIDLISQSESRIYVNSEGSETYGVEFELSYLFLENLFLNMNYTFLSQEPKDKERDDFIITVPEHQIYAAINWEFTPKWSANLRSNFILERKRASLDARDSINNYTLLDFTLQGKQILGGLGITFKVNNLLDENIREPSIDNISIPNDIPLEGRSFMGIVSMSF